MINATALLFLFVLIYYGEASWTYSAPGSLSASFEF